MATTLSQAGSIENVLNSPQYSRELQDYYLSTYAPGLTQATFGINAAENAFQANEGTRTRQRGEAVRRIAGDYASRGMRTPGAINRDRSQVQDQFANLSRQERAAIQELQNQRDVLYGTGAQSGETFMNNPALFGSIGAGARRSALSGLQSLPEQYGLLGVGPSTAPMAEAPMQAEAPAPQPVTIASLLPQASVAAPARVSAPAAPKVATAPKKAATANRSSGSGLNRRYAI
jgi:hypothetical protein